MCARIVRSSLDKSTVPPAEAEAPELGEAPLDGIDAVQGGSRDRGSAGQVLGVPAVTNGNH